MTRRHVFPAVLLLLALCIISAAALLVWASFRVGQTDSAVFAPDRIGDVPPHEYALLLGTSKRIGKGPNGYFLRRIEAAAALYHAGKVKKIIVSGDNRRHGYNEPEDMKQALMEKGVPGNDILPDYAGFRTLDSVVRARSVFGANSFIVVSQRFHCRRAIYLAEKNGLRAIGFEAEDVGMKWRYRRYVREALACCAAWLDVHVLNTKPHFER